MGFVVRPKTAQNTQDPPFDIGSFGWGLLAGAIATLALEAATIYFTWPILVGFVKAVGLGAVMREALRE